MPSLVCYTQHAHACCSQSISCRLPARLTSQECRSRPCCHTSYVSQPRTLVVCAASTSGRERAEENSRSYRGDYRREGGGNSNSKWYTGPRPGQGRPRDDDRSRPERGRQGSDWDRPPRPRQEAGPSRPASRDSSPADAPVERQFGFEAMFDRLRRGQSEGLVIKKEAWEKLFGLFETPSQAHQVLDLMLADATVRDSDEWDWNTHGYGQTIFQLVQAAGSVGAYDVSEEILSHTADLRLTINKDFVPNMMRKLAAVEAPVAHLEKLYAKERELKGKNSHMGAHELSRVYRRQGVVAKVKGLLKQVEEGTVDMKGELQTDLQEWLLKRGSA